MILNLENKAKLRRKVYTAYDEENFDTYQNFYTIMEIGHNSGKFRMVYGHFIADNSDIFAYRLIYNNHIQTNKVCITYKDNLVTPQYEEYYRFDDFNELKYVYKTLRLNKALQNTPRL